MRKVLLIGGNGLVGQGICQALQDKYQVVITAGHQGKHFSDGTNRMVCKIYS